MVTAITEVEATTLPAMTLATVVVITPGVKTITQVDMNISQVVEAMKTMGAVRTMGAPGMITTTGVVGTALRREASTLVRTKTITKNTNTGRLHTEELVRTSWLVGSPVSRCQKWDVLGAVEKTKQKKQKQTVESK